MSYDRELVRLIAECEEGWKPCEGCGRLCEYDFCGPCYEEYVADIMNGMVQGEDY